MMGDAAADEPGDEAVANLAAGARDEDDRLTHERSTDGAPLAILAEWPA